MVLLAIYYIFFTCFLATLRVYSFQEVQVNKFTKILGGVAAVAIIAFFAACSSPIDSTQGSARAALSATDTTTLVAGGTIGNVASSAAFTSGANSTVNGYVTAVAAVTLGANSRVNGNVTAGAAFTMGATAVVTGNVNAVGDIVLGANAHVLGSVHSGSGVITYGAGATVGSIN